MHAHVYEQHAYRRHGGDVGVAQLDANIKRVLAQEPNQVFVLQKRRKKREMYKWDNDAHAKDTNTLFKSGHRCDMTTCEW